MRILNGTALIALAFLAVACGLSNTMYNARNYFDSALERPLNSNGKPSPQAVDDYTKAIKKCGIIITEKKKGKTLEEALFIMAAALYLKGNSSFQAKDQFENLIRLNPEGKYVPEAHIYLAKVLRDINQPNEADALLERFIRDPKFKKEHPRALLTLADFEIMDKDYYRAQFWLEKIINEYPKTKLYRDAYFLFGKNYYVQEDYQRSLEEFGKLSKIRRIDKGLRLEAQYYIALNHYELRAYASALKAIREVIRAEIRTDKLALAKVLQGRIMLKGKDPDKGKTELEAVTKDYPRSQASGLAAYYLADYQFYQEGDRAAALINYAKVRTEFPTGDYVTAAQAKIAALTQLNTGARLNSELAVQQFLDYHYLAAENYFSLLNLPDSCFMMYQRVISEKDSLLAKLDSLRSNENALVARIDSLSVLLPLVPLIEEKTELIIEDKVVADSVIAGADSSAVVSVTPSPQEPEANKTVIDSLGLINENVVIDTGINLADSTSTVSDSLRFDTGLNLEYATITADDSLLVGSSISLADSTSSVTDSLAIKTGPDIEALQRQKTSAEAELTALQNRIENLQKVITRFEDEVIPFVYFAMGNSYLKLNRKDPELSDLLSYMREHYPQNKYTNSMGQLYNGESVRVIDPELERQENLLETALGEAETNPDSMLVKLQALSASADPQIQLKANFRLGWYYAIQQADTLSAQAYFDAVLKATDGGEYALLTRNFYDGRNFLIYRPIAAPDTTVSDSLEVIELIDPEITIPDSLLGADFALTDSLSGNVISVQDSISSVPQPLQEEPKDPELNPEGTDLEIQAPEPVIKEEPLPPLDPNTPNEEAPLE